MKKFKTGIAVPQIKRSPGSFEGAEFSFKEILLEMVELEANTQCQMYITNVVHKLYESIRI